MCARNHNFLKFLVDDSTRFLGLKQQNKDSHFSSEVKLNDLERIDSTIHDVLSKNIKLIFLRSTQKIGSIM